MFTILSFHFILLSLITITMVSKNYTLRKLYYYYYYYYYYLLTYLLTAIEFSLGGSIPYTNN